MATDREAEKQAGQQRRQREGSVCRTVLGAVWTWSGCHQERPWPEEEKVKPSTPSGGRISSVVHRRFHPPGPLLPVAKIKVGSLVAVRPRHWLATRKPGDAGLVRLVACLRLAPPPAGPVVAGDRDMASRDLLIETSPPPQHG